VVEADWGTSARDARRVDGIAPAGDVVERSLGGGWHYWPVAVNIFVVIIVIVIFVVFVFVFVFVVVVVILLLISIIAVRPVHPPVLRVRHMCRVVLDRAPILLSLFLHSSHEGVETRQRCELLLAWDRRLGTGDASELKCTVEDSLSGPGRGARLLASRTLRTC
jgi:hypothetical protein